MPDLTELLTRGGVALVLGALVGLERQARLEAGSVYERDLDEPTGEEKPPSSPATPDAEQLAGVRTFAILSLAGMLATLWESPWVFPAALICVTALLTVGYLRSIEVAGDAGLTSEFAALVVFLVGGLCGEGHTVFAASAAAGLALLLSIKQRLHRFASRLRRQDIQAAVKFAALSAIVLPLLPVEPIAVSAHFGGGEPVDAWWSGLSLDLRKVWWMVIFVSSISFVGYFLSKLLGAERGLIWTGVVGGLASSTAVSLSHAKRSQDAPELSRELAIGLLLANLIMPLRVLLMVLFVSPWLAGWAAFPTLLTALATGGAVLLLRRDKSSSEVGEAKLPNPFSIGPALKFGLLFALVMLLAQGAQSWFGGPGLYVLAFIAGLTDADAITLTGAELHTQGEISAIVAVTVVTFAIVGNTVFKAGVVLWLGTKTLRLQTAGAFSAMIVAALGGLFVVRLLV